MKTGRLLQIGTVLFSTSLVAVFITCKAKQSTPSSAPNSATPSTQKVILPGSKSSIHDVDGENILYGTTVFSGSKSAVPIVDRPVLPGSKSGIILEPPPPTQDKGFHINPTAPPATAPTKP